MAYHAGGRKVKSSIRKMIGKVSGYTIRKMRLKFLRAGGTEEGFLKFVNAWKSDEEQKEKEALCDVTSSDGKE